MRLIGVYLLFLSARQICNEDIITERSFELFDYNGKRVKLKRKIGIKLSRLPWDEWIKNNGGELVIPKQVMELFPPMTRLKVILTQNSSLDTKKLSKKRKMQNLKKEQKAIQKMERKKAKWTKKLKKNKWKLTSSEKTILLQEHNKARSSCYPPACKMKYMYWDKDLEDSAHRHVMKCSWEHDQERSLDVSSPHRYIGQNMAAFLGRRDVAFATTLWKDESRYYNIYKDECEEGEVCGHYKQMVWENTTLVGCALRKCEFIEHLGYENSYLVVCNYAPDGNFRNKRPYQIGRRCSKCSSENMVCREGICV